MIDHTILKADATREQVRRFCNEARRYEFRAVCINSIYVPLVAGLLEGSQVRVCSVVGFPLGAVPAVIKAAEAKAAIEAGAQEIDMVIHIGALKEGRSDEVLADIAAVRAVCRGAVLKVIIEAGLLTDDEKREACRLSVQAGADFVKTSTGFSSGGAIVDDVALMRGVVGPNLGVKASGGIRTVHAALEMIEAGANRIGTSSGIELLQQSEPITEGMKP